MRIISDEELDRVDPDARLVRDSPCFCGRKSVSRIREYDNGKLYLFAVCRDHIEVLKKMVEDIID